MVNGAAPTRSVLALSCWALSWCHSAVAAADALHLPTVQASARRMAGAGEYAAAVHLLDQALGGHPGDLDTLYLKGELLEAAGKPLEAIAVYDELFRWYPRHEGPKHLKARALMDLGANSLALEYMAGDGAPADAVLLARAQANTAMHHIRWGEPQSALAGSSGEGSSDRPRAPAASREAVMLRTLDTVHHAWEAFGPRSVAMQAAAEIASHLPAVERERFRQRMDRIVALRRVERMRDVIREYEALLRETAVVPPWVQQAAGDAYLYLRQPEQALRLYRRVVAQEPASHHARMALYHALIELERFREAEAVLGALDQETPARVVERGVLQDNWRKAEIAYNRAWLLMYEDRLEEADASLRQLHALGPFNTHVRSARAHAWLWRGWPRKAREEFAIIQQMTPELISAANGYAVTLNALGEKRRARDMNRTLLEQEPTDAHLVRTRRAFEIEAMREVTVDFTHAAEHPGLDEWRLTVRGEQPVTLHHRLMAEVAHRETRQSGPDARQKRLALGGGWEPSATWQVSGAMTGEYDTGEELGWRASAAVAPDDHWTFGVDHDSHTLDVPLRSRSADLTAGDTGFRARLRASELWSTEGRAVYRQASDGNDTWSLAWATDTALTTRAHWKTRLASEVGSSRNSLTDVPYYSPRWVTTAYLVPMLEHTWFRRYERSLVDRLFVGLGRAWQQAFRPQAVWYLRYEQDWALTDTCGLVGGLTYGQRNYDGEDVNTLEVSSRLRWRF